jgi:outer membrane protein OmpA-like peptidoglycan-associated protein
MITSKINGGKGTVGKLVNDSTLYQEAAAGVTSLHEDADALQHNFLLRGFFRNRGYASPDEVKKHVVSQLPKESPSKSFMFDPKNLFEKPDSAKLKNPKLLNPAGEFLQANQFESAVIVTSYGMKGDSEQTRVLTDARSFAVRKYLVENFKLDDARIKTIGLGKKADDGPEGKAELLIYGLGKEQAQK